VKYYTDTLDQEAIDAIRASVDSAGMFWNVEIDYRPIVDVLSHFVISDCVSLGRLKDEAYELAEYGVLFDFEKIIRQHSVAYDEVYCVLREFRKLTREQQRTYMSVKPLPVDRYEYPSILVDYHKRLEKCSC
jgi:hypothetical protein